MPFPIPHQTVHTAAGFDPGYDFVNGQVNEIMIPIEESVDWTEFVTSQSVDGQPLVSANQRTRVRMVMPLEVPGFVIRNIEANEKLPSSTTSQDVYELEIGSSAFLLIKIDQAIARTETIASYLAQLMAGAERNRVKLMLRYAAELMSAGVAASNRGANAGHYGSYNLGTVSAPLAWAPDQVFTIASIIKVILQESKSWVDGEMFSIIPLEATTSVEMLISNSISATTAKDEKFHPYMPKNLYGFNFIVDMERTLYRSMKDRKPVYEILFGNRNATLLYCSSLVMEVGTNTDLTVLHDYVRFLISFGGAVIKSTGLASVIAAIDTPQTKLI